jgi:unsaturated rhamnogalacturonyl hydrolase
MYVNSVSGQQQSISIYTAADLMRSSQNTSGVTAVKANRGRIGADYILQGIDHLWEETADGIYFHFIQESVDKALDAEGNLQHYKGEDLGVQASQYARSSLTLYKVTGQKKYFVAATRLWGQMQEQANCKPDDFSIATPFYAEYAALIHNDNVLDMITHLFLFREPVLEREKTGLDYEKSISQYGLALVEVLDYFPESRNRKLLLRVLNRCTDKIRKLVSLKSGDWSDVELLSRSRYMYTLTKAARLGYVANTSREVIANGYASLKENNSFAKDSVNTGGLDLEKKGLWLLAINEFELYNLPMQGRGRTVMLDSYFNNETRIDQSGNLVHWHYKWDERDDNGFSMWAGQFRRAGYQTSTLYTAPRMSNLKNSAVYIIVDPDTKKENKEPSFIAASDISAVSRWVKSGGVLLLMANDSANTELDNLNRLAAQFGVQFNKDSKGKVTGNQFDMGKITISGANPVFKTAHQVFIKEFSSLKLTGSAESILKNEDGDTVVAAVKFGRGTVLFIGDPWLYNEYVDGRKLPAEYDNFKAGKDVVNWINNQLQD